MRFVLFTIPAGAAHEKPMAGSLILGLVCLLIMMSISNPAFAGKKLQPDTLEQAQNYVLAACMINSYKGEAIADEAQAWAGGLVENGSLSAANYAALYDLAKMAPPPGVAQQGAVMRLQNCVEFSRSKKVVARIKTVLSH